MARFTQDARELRFATQTVPYELDFRVPFVPEQSLGRTTLWGRETTAGASLRSAKASWLAPKQDAPKLPKTVAPEFAKTRSHVDCLALGQQRVAQSFDQSYCYFRKPQDVYHTRASDRVICVLPNDKPAGFADPTAAGARK